VDTFIGGMMMEGRLPEGVGLLVTGRISAELAPCPAPRRCVVPMGGARVVAGLALALGACLARPADAQTAEQPNLIFTISGGVLEGGSLWSLPRQLVYAGQNAFGNVWDTAALGRRLHTGFLATVTASYFWTPHLGLNAEAGLFGLESVSACAPVGTFTPTPATNNQNAQACSRAQGANLPGDAEGFLAGLTYRFTTRGVQPYVRAEAGGALLGSSFIETIGDALVNDSTVSTVYLLADENHKELTWMASLGAGLTFPLGPGYQLRLEARDIIIALPRPNGPATDTARIANDGALPDPPIGTRIVSVPSFTIGLDVVLERRRGHRY